MVLVFRKATYLHIATPNAMTITKKATAQPITGEKIFLTIIFFVFTLLSLLFSFVVFVSLFPLLVL